MKYSRVRLERIAAKFLKILKQKDATVSVFLLSNREMEQLKRRFFKLKTFRGKEAIKIRGEKATNVLSLPEPSSFPGPAGRKRRLGEIYLNYQYHGVDRSELVYLLAHGLLHLLGYKHDKKRDMIKMQKAEKKLCAAVGIRR